MTPRPACVGRFCFASTSWPLLSQRSAAEARMTAPQTLPRQPGLVPGIHVFMAVQNVDGSTRCGHDGAGVIPGARSAGRGSIPASGADEDTAAAVSLLPQLPWFWIPACAGMTPLSVRRHLVTRSRIACGVRDDPCGRNKQKRGPRAAFLLFSLECPSQSNRPLAWASMV